ncbi:MAG: hypothetical protein JW966_08645 [Anaerolineae bacterium]|nr:hypothetical protein [Anaerolineae bacterium]
MANAAARFRGAGTIPALVFVMVLTGCTLVSSQEGARSAGEVQADLSARLTDTRSAQAAALALWDRVIVGEDVSCQETLPVPGPVNLPARDLRAYPQAETIQGQLNAAIQAVHNSADLWTIECNDPRELVPLEMAREGRATALTAAAPISEAESLLAAWQPAAGSN